MHDACVVTRLLDRAFEHTKYTSLASTVLGQSDISLAAKMSSSYDLDAAIKKFKFALLPKVNIM